MSEDDLGQRIAKAQEAQKQQQAKRNAESGNPAAAAALGHAMTFVSAIVLGILIGHTIDNLAHTGPWGLLIFMLFGTAAGFLSILRAAKAMNAAAEKNAQGPGADGHTGSKPVGSDRPHTTDDT